tara:strand:- start:440 stop:952 length:513 start_codon:yes stop_codon:yes gene_type:complete
MRRIYDAAKILNTKEEDIFEEFNKRGEKKAFNFISENAYRPLNITKGYMERQIEIKEKLEDQFSNQTFNFPLNDRVLNRIEKMQDRMSNLKLNKKFEELIDLEDYLIPEERSDLPTNAAPLPLQDQPNPQVVSTPMPAPGAVTQSGLTPTEQALLSPDEQAIRLRQRGMV